MVVLNHTHTQGHFYGVQYGRQFQDWNALPGPDMRASLDSVHQEVGLLTINASPFNEGSLAESARVEEGPILEELDVDVYASGSWGAGLLQIKTIHHSNGTSMGWEHQFTLQFMNGYSELQSWNSYQILTGELHNGYAN